MGDAIIGVMKTEDARKHYANNVSELARALGMDQSTFYSWGEFPPPLRQLQLEAVTGGALKAEPECDKFRPREAAHG
jgi:hypothetical protein